MARRLEYKQARMVGGSLDSRRYRDEVVERLPRGYYIEEVVETPQTAVYERPLRLIPISKQTKVGKGFYSSRTN